MTLEPDQILPFFNLFHRPLALPAGRRPHGNSGIVLSLLYEISTSYIVSLVMYVYVCVCLCGVRVQRRQMKVLEPNPSNTSFLPAAATFLLGNDKVAIIIMFSVLFVSFAKLNMSTRVYLRIHIMLHLLSLHSHTHTNTHTHTHTHGNPVNPWPVSRSVCC